MVPWSCRFPDQSTDCSGPPQTQSNDSPDRVEGLGKLQRRRDPRVAIALAWDLLLHKCSGNRSESGTQNRCACPSKATPRELQLRDNGTCPARHCQIPPTWHASMKAWRDYHPAGTLSKSVSPQLQCYWN